MIQHMSNILGVTPAEITEALTLFGYALGGAAFGLIIVLTLFAAAPLIGKGLRFAQRLAANPSVAPQAVPAQ